MRLCGVKNNVPVVGRAVVGHCGRFVVDPARTSDIDQARSIATVGHRRVVSIPAVLAVRRSAAGNSVVVSS